MRLFFNILLLIYTLFAGMLLRTEPMDYFTKWALFSSLPIALILLNMNSTQIRMQEIINSSFRIRSILYLLSCVTFLFCVLCALDLFSLQNLIWEHILGPWPPFSLAVLLFVSALLIGNILILIRDSVRRDKGLLL